jgi:hypothetical protein
MKFEFMGMLLFLAARSDDRHDAAADREHPDADPHLRGSR